GAAVGDVAAVGLHHVAATRELLRPGPDGTDRLVVAAARRAVAPVRLAAGHRPDRVDPDRAEVKTRRPALRLGEESGGRVERDLQVAAGLPDLEGLWPGRLGLAGDVQGHAHRLGLAQRGHGLAGRAGHAVRRVAAVLLRRLRDGRRRAAL